MTNTQRVTFPSSAGEASGVLATPDGAGKPPGVVVIQEWWGINDQIKTVAERYAAEGFLALVPDLYHGKLAKDAEEASAMMRALESPASGTFRSGHGAQYKQHMTNTQRVTFPPVQAKRAASW